MRLEPTDTRLKAVLWRARWWVRHFPRQAFHRLTTCRHGHVALYDGIACMECGAPWFKGTLQ